MTDQERKAAETKWAGKFATLGGLERFCSAQKPVDHERVDPKQYEERAGSIEGAGGYRPISGKRYHP